ncbi:MULTISPECIES: LPS assembly lipoprotein LptE [Phenylobacterium]|uniref:LPS-assembly lipoprotein n=1 Tax=Phenylobacterium koreense TaxID=266125 RepID=A0ABV2EIQ3_9CAUL
MNRTVVSAVLLAAAVGLAGCGFTPLYGTPGVTAQLASVQVMTPPGRTGQLIREHLDDALARDKGAAPQYRMDLAVSETRYPRGVRVDNVATRYEYVLTANYTLVASSTGAAVKRGIARAQVTYDSADQPYASITAQQDAQDRAAAECARKIQLEVAAWMANQARS